MSHPEVGSRRKHHCSSVRRQNETAKPTKKNSFTPTLQAHHLPHEDGFVVSGHAVRRRLHTAFRGALWLTQFRYGARAFRLFAQLIRHNGSPALCTAQIWLLSKPVRPQSAFLPHLPVRPALAELVAIKRHSRTLNPTPCTHTLHVVQAAGYQGVVIFLHGFEQVPRVRSIECKLSTI